MGNPLPVLSMMTTYETTINRSPVVEYSAKVAFKPTLRQRLAKWLCTHLLCAKEVMKDLDRVDAMVDMVGEEMDCLGSTLEQYIEHINDDIDNALTCEVVEERLINERFDMSCEDVDVQLQVCSWVDMPLPIRPEALVRWDEIAETGRAELAQLNLLDDEARNVVATEVLERVVQRTRELVDENGLTLQQLQTLRGDHERAYRDCFIVVEGPSTHALARKKVPVFRCVRGCVMPIKHARPRRHRKRFYPRLVSEVVLNTRAKLGKLNDTEANRRVCDQHMRKSLVKLGCRLNIIDIHVAMAVDLFFGELYHDRYNRLVMDTNTALAMNARPSGLSLYRRVAGRN